MDFNFIIAIATMGGLEFIFAGGLAFADKKLRVEENPLIGKINELLPNANCGGCSWAGCYDFALNVVEGKAPISGCPVGGNETSKSIAELLGMDATSSVKMIPLILCKGGNSASMKKSTDYFGPNSCKTLNTLSGGNKLCFYGCLGSGDCVAACPFGAMIMTDDGLPMVIEELCTGCGICAKTCPRNIIEMHPENRNVFVFCKNIDDPKSSKNVCKVACIGCGICARKSDGGIVMDGYLAKIDYDKLDESKIPFDKCSTKALQKVHKNNLICTE